MFRPFYYNGSHVILGIHHKSDLIIHRLDMRYRGWILLIICEIVWGNTQARVPEKEALQHLELLFSNGEVHQILRYTKELQQQPGIRPWFKGLQGIRMERLIKVSCVCICVCFRVCG